MSNTKTNSNETKMEKILYIDTAKKIASLVTVTGHNFEDRSESIFSYAKSESTTEELVAIYKPTKTVFATVN